MASTAPDGPRLVADNGPDEGDRPGAGVGAILRGARLARGEDIQAVSSALRIRKPYLEAIEDGRVEDLPGLTYGIGFVRAYAEYLNLNIDETVARFKDESSRIDVKTQLQFPEPLPGNRVPGGLLLACALVIAGSVYGGYLYTSSKDMTFVEAVEAVPADLMALVSSEEATTETSATPEAEPQPAAAPTTAPEPAEVQPVAETVAEAASEEVATTLSEAEADVGTDAEAAIDTVVEEAQEEIADASSASAITETVVEEATPEVSQTETAEEALSEPATIVEQTVETIGEPEPASEPAPEATTASTPEPETVVEPAVEPAVEPESVAEAVPAPDAEPVAGDVSVAELPPPPAAEAEAAVEGAATASAGTIEATDLPPPSLPEPDTEPAPDPVETAEVVAEESAVAPADIAAAPAQEEASSLRIIIQATNEVWVRVVTPDGTALIEKLMLMGEIYRVPDRPGLVMETGNAGALKLIVNGTMAPSLGEIGEVRRGIALTEEGLLGG